MGLVLSKLRVQCAGMQVILGRKSIDCDAMYALKKEDSFPAVDLCAHSFVGNRSSASHTER